MGLSRTTAALGCCSMCNLPSTKSDVQLVIQPRDEQSVRSNSHNHARAHARAECNLHLHTQVGPNQCMSHATAIRRGNDVVLTWRKAPASTLMRSVMWYVWWKWLHELAYATATNSLLTWSCKFAFAPLTTATWASTLYNPACGGRGVMAQGYTRPTSAAPSAEHEQGGLAHPQDPDLSGIRTHSERVRGCENLIPAHKISVSSGCDGRPFAHND